MKKKVYYQCKLMKEHIAIVFDEKRSESYLYKNKYKKHYPKSQCTLKQRSPSQMNNKMSKPL